MEGLYEIEFAAPGASGTGVVCIKDGAVNGADESFMYRGKVEATSPHSFHGEIKVDRYNDKLMSVMGVDNYVLVVSGSVPPGSDTIRFDGFIKGDTSRAQLRIHGRKIGEPA